METRIAVTPAEGTVIHTQILSQCNGGLQYHLLGYDKETRRSVFEIRGEATDPAKEVLKQNLTSRGAIFEIFEVEVEYAVKEKVEDVAEPEFEDGDENEFADKFEDPVGNQDPAERRVVATA